MIYVEFFIQSLFYPVFNALKLIQSAFLNDHMGIQRCIVFAHLPKMHMVNVDNAFDIGHSNNDGIGIDIHRAAQHECSDGSPDLCQTQVENIPRDPYGDCRINPPYVVEQNKRPPNDHRDRRECIREVMKEQSTDVNAVFLHRIRKQSC